MSLNAALLLGSCKGDPGPPGMDGVNILGKVFEVTVNFDYNPQANAFVSNYYTYPFTVYESDAILVYRYEGQAGIGGGQTADVWSPLPQNIYFNNGDIIQYIFTNTFVDIQLLIEGNFNLGTLNDPNFLDDQIFRIAVVPAEFANNPPSMEQLLESMNMDDAMIERIEQ